MKSIRLNQTIREKIKQNIQAAWEQANEMPKEIEYRETFKGIIAQAVHTSLLKEQKELDKLAKRYPHLSHRLVQAGDYDHVRIHSDALDQYVDIKAKDLGIEYLPSPAFALNFDRLVTDLSMEDLVKSKPAIDRAMRKAREKVSDWELKRDRYMDQVNDVVCGVNTTKQLIEVWPEVVKFFPKGLFDPSHIQLPAVSVADLNAQL